MPRSTWSDGLPAHTTENPGDDDLGVNGVGRRRSRGSRRPRASRHRVGAERPSGRHPVSATVADVADRSI